MGEPSVIQAVIWAGVSLVIVLLGLRSLRAIVRDVLALRQAENEVHARKIELDRRRFDSEAELNEYTVEERAELAKAEFTRQAAEQHAAAEVALKTIPYQVEARRAEIEGEAEGLALVAKERAISGAVGTNSVAAVVAGYTAYMNHLTAAGLTELILPIQEWAGESALLPDCEHNAA